MLVTIRLEMDTVLRLGTKAAAEDFAQRMEQATCYLMLRMWAAGLFTADGWTIQRIEERPSIRYAAARDEVASIVNLRPYNNRTRRNYQEQTK